MNPEQRKQKARLKARRHAFVTKLQQAAAELDPIADGRILKQTRTLIDRLYNAKDHRYQPKTLVRRAILNGYGTRETIESVTLISGRTLDDALTELIFDGEIVCEDNLYFEAF